MHCGGTRRNARNEIGNEVGGRAIGISSRSGALHAAHRKGWEGGRRAPLAPEKEAGFPQNQVDRGPMVLLLRKGKGRNLSERSPPYMRKVLLSLRRFKKVCTMAPHRKYEKTPQTVPCFREHGGRNNPSTHRRGLSTSVPPPLPSPPLRC